MIFGTTKITKGTKNQKIFFVSLVSFVVQEVDAGMHSGKA